MAAWVAEKFIFVNIPKMGGKYSTGLFRWAQVKTKNIGKGHMNVDQSQLPNLPVIMTVRHPITFLSSLWCHRQRSKKPWQPEERDVASDNWLEFVDRVCEKPDWIHWWIHRWIDEYHNVKLIRMESLWDQWIDLWDEIDQPYNSTGAKIYRDEQINRDSWTQEKLAELDNVRIQKIRQTQPLFFEKHNYDIDWTVVPYGGKKTLKGLDPNKVDFKKLAQERNITQ